MSSTRVIGIICMVLLCTGCGDDEVSVHAEASIGPEGGSLTSGDDRATLSIPPGALTETRNFIVDAEGEEPPMELVGVSYSFGPRGSFDELAHVTLGYSDLASPSSARELRVAYSPDGISWSCITHAEDEEDGSLRAITDHLSIFAIVRLTCGANDDCTAPEKCVRGACGIPCLIQDDCPLPLVCHSDGVCVWKTCEDGEGCEGDRDCSAGPGEGRGICNSHCSLEGEPGGTCGDPTEQFECTMNGDCILAIPCTNDDSCAAYEEGKICWEGWCVSPSWGCDCGIDGCPCEQ